MNIIERVRQILTEYPEIAAVCNAVHIDFTDPEPQSYGLAPVDDALLTEDIIGNQRRQHTFLLYAVCSSINDWERLQNSSALLGLGYWLHSQTGLPIDGGQLDRITVGNAMLYDLPQENGVQGVRYQMQITAEYTLFA